MFNIKSYLVVFICSFLFNSVFALVPTDPKHPGSQIYNFQFTEAKFNCAKRNVVVFLPQPLNLGTSVIVFGHGQSLDVEHYRDTYIHLAKKGIAVIHPSFSTGFFDTNWTRMGRDYINQAKCITDQIKELNVNSVVFSGHSKGAYVAGVAGGLAFKESLALKPSSVLLMNAAGLDPQILKSLDPSVEMTVVYSDKDSIVKKQISEDLYSLSPSFKKQFILVKSYPKSSGKIFEADHFWPLTKSTWLGGTTANPLHYNGSWKWLVSAAEDYDLGSNGTNPYLYTSLASDKGIVGLVDDIARNF